MRWVLGDKLGLGLEFELELELGNTLPEQCRVRARTGDEDTTH